LKKINALAIRTDGGTQVRFKLHEDKVAEYAELMKEGIVFPPLVVFHDGVDYWLADGFHRFFAYKKNGNTAIDCDVRQGTLEDAKRFARTANNKHGIPLSVEEWKAIANYYFTSKEYQDWSTRQIAKELGKSNSTISRWRAELTEAPAQVTYVRDGKKLTMKTDKIGKSDKVAPKKEKATIPHGTVTPTIPSGTVENDKIQELSYTIEELHQELTAAKDVIASKRWDATEIEQEDLLETVQQLREELKMRDMEIATLRDSRDMFQQKNAELIRQLNSLKKKIGI